MPKDYFKLENCTSLSALSSGTCIHVIGVCGVAMAQLSVLLSKRGFVLSGSDKEFYEPMGSLLKNSSVKLFEGYAKQNVPEDAGLVLIGNTISYGNPEVDAVEEKKLPYTCFPKIMAETIIAGKHSIVASGTHGKTTTSAMIAFMLKSINSDPSYFIGGITQDLDSSLYAGSGPFTVVEGDEYDSAFFAKVPKFSFYKPKTCIINAVEFDHADIYPDLNAINTEFTNMVSSIPADGCLICCIDFENTEKLISTWKTIAKCPIITFGEGPSSDFKILSCIQKGIGQNVNVQSKKYGDFSFELSVPGVFNARNALSALIIAKIYKLDFAKCCEALKNFKGVKRRQQIRFSNEKYLLVEDFAHHPTAVRETINALRSAYPDKKLISVFEPRSNTSRRKVFQDDYIKAFGNAGQVILCDVSAKDSDQGHELLDVNTLSLKINQSGVPGLCLPNPPAIEDYLIKNLKANSLILIMSNGAFGNLPARIEEHLKKLP